MLYSIGPATVLIINLILNRESFRSYGFLTRKQDKQRLVQVRYNRFLLAANVYFIVDMMWGILYERKEIQALFPFIYSLTVFYFLFMLLTMLAWTEFIVAYLDKRGRGSKVLLYIVWAMFVIGIICLMLNRFYHFVFSFNEAGEYIGETGRNISFLLQIAFYAMITTYMFYVAHKSAGRQKRRFQAVAASGMVLGSSLIFQIFYAFLPSYAMGLMIGICLVHSFVQANERKEKKIHDHIASVMAEDYEAIFYINLESEDYLTFAKSQKYMTI